MRFVIVRGHWTLKPRWSFSGWLRTRTSSSGSDLHTAYTFSWCVCEQGRKSGDLVQTSAVSAVSWVWLSSSLICSEVLVFNSDESAPTVPAMLRIVTMRGIINKCYMELLKYTYINSPN